VLLVSRLDSSPSFPRSPPHSPFFPLYCLHLPLVLFETIELLRLILLTWKCASIAHRASASLHSPSGAPSPFFSVLPSVADPHFSPNRRSSPYDSPTSQPSSASALHPPDRKTHVFPITSFLIYPTVVPVLTLLRLFLATTFRGLVLYAAGQPRPDASGGPLRPPARRLWLGMGVLQRFALVPVPPGPYPSSPTILRVPRRLS